MTTAQSKHTDEVLQEMHQFLQALAPQALEIRDDSAQHRGHQHGGGGHYTVKIVSSQFSGKSLIMRHRMVYQALSTLVPAKIHALSIDARASDEVV
jgi:BolA protein